MVHIFLFEYHAFNQFRVQTIPHIFRYAATSFLFTSVALDVGGTNITNLAWTYDSDMDFWAEV